MSGREVVIVGGGIAGLSAAFELTDPSHCRMRSKGCTCHGERRDKACSLPRKVSVYELRNVLGGKGASVRNVELDHRIEEHGLHIWFGYYENAFRLLDRCHRELDERAARGKPRWSSALTHVADGFRPASTVGLAEDDAYGAWTRWWTTFPEDNALPWNRRELDQPAEFDLRWFLPEIGRRTTGLLHAAVRSLLTGDDPGELEQVIEAADLALGDLDPVLDRLLSAALRWSNYLRRQSGHLPRPALVALALTSLRANDQLLDYIRESRDLDIAGSPAVRRSMTIVDLLVGATRGLLEAGIATDADIDRLDDWEWSEWLAAHGVLSSSRDSTLVRALSYCLPFAYERGSRDLPSFSAAVGLRLFLRTFFTYRGALMWKMNHGMGEVVFAPLYELLRKRGVEFHFEHALSGLEIADAHVTGLRFERPRAEPENRREHWPLELEIGESKLPYWPLSDLAAEHRTLRLKTKSRDVVFALPLPALVEAAPSLFEETETGKPRYPRWYDLIKGRQRSDGTRTAGIESVATQSAQLWLTRATPAALGWPHDVTVSGFSEPFDTFSDMSELLASEPVPERGPVPLGLVYLCSTRDG
ncbi:MAG TPA: NAD(P)-binding protein, partial [Polyangiales bacterium]|nr:NAD(P)-binding protein [Polyangiales bacterium]